MDRASKTDSLAAEEESVSSVMKKPRVEEEEEEEDEEEEEEEGYVLYNHLWLKHVPEKESEWDVDSHDGREYKSDPEDRKYFSDEEEYNKYRLRKREIFDSKGFLPDFENDIFSLCDLEVESEVNNTNREELTNLASLCFKKLNEDKGKCVELDSIVRATVSGGARWKIRITCMAKEYPNGPLVEYQAKVMRFAGDCKPPFPILCRPTPEPGIYKPA